MAIIGKRKIVQREIIRLGERTYTPEQLSAFLPQKIKRDAESFLGEAVAKAVVTVPPISTTINALPPRMRCGSLHNETR